jgi:site-specific DNA-methyltransferase (cytosine-N4-specific)
MSSSGNGESRAEKKVTLFFHRYRYFPYEKDLAKREVQRFAPHSRIDQSANGLVVTGPVDVNRLRKLTYVSAIATDGTTTRTMQHDLENSVSRRPDSPARQSTRYSAHALHEYKGRFNPQIVGFLLNYLGADAESRIFDPFCGSGTTLVESAIHGIESVGIDINPLAVFISTAKFSALATPADEIRAALMRVLESFDASLRYEQLVLLEPDDRQTYLAAWFMPDVLATLEALRKSITDHAGNARRILLALVSDLLRDYSLQEPTDLRIRRRISAMPTKPLMKPSR